MWIFVYEYIRAMIAAGLNTSQSSREERDFLVSRKSFVLGTLIHNRIGIRWRCEDWRRVIQTVCIDIAMLIKVT